MKSIKLLNQLSRLIAITVLIIFSGCGMDDTNPAGSSGSANDNLTLSAKSDENVTDANEIIITEAKALISEVELETEPSSISIHLPVSPFVVNLNSVDMVRLIASAKIPEGIYSKIKFQIHKPEDNETPPDPEFKEGESGNKRYSIIIKGTYNGNPFVYKSKKSANAVIFFNRLINIGTGRKNITMLINPALWFKSGDVYLDPNNSSNQNQIDDNIRNSFKRAFRDDNRDGLPDDN